MPHETGTPGGLTELEGRLPEIREANVITAAAAGYDAPVLVRALADSGTSGHSRATTHKVSPASAAAAANRDAVLSSLYKERSPLLRKRRLSQATADDLAYLSDLERYIDSIEARHSPAVPSPSLWQQIDQLAVNVLQARSDLEREKQNKR
jgi:hypothetical protein